MEIGIATTKLTMVEKRSYIDKIAHIEHLIFRIATTAMVASALVKITSFSFSSFDLSLDNIDLKKLLPFGIGITVGLVGLSAFITIFVVILRHPAKPSFRLKREMVDAYTLALEQSSLNPKPH